MTFMDDLLTPEDVAAGRLLSSLSKGLTRCARKRASDRTQKAKLEQWRRGVWLRDKSACRNCGITVVKDFQSLRRGDCNHIAGRRDKSVKYDVRNGMLLCRDCHLLVTGTIGVKVTIVQDERFWFYLEGRHYIDATHPVDFIRNLKEHRMNDMSSQPCGCDPGAHHVCDECTRKTAKPECCKHKMGIRCLCVCHAEDDARAEAEAARLEGLGNGQGSEGDVL